MGDKILIADDSAESLTLLCTMLNSAMPDLELVSRSDGTGALAAIEEGGFNLVLLDAVMPGMSGFDVCRRLKQGEATRRIPVLMISGIMTESQHRASGLDLGADGYLCKPFEREELLAQVRALLRLKQMADFQHQHEVRLARDLALRTQSLRQSEERLRYLFDHSPDAIFVEDFNGVVLDVNEAACRLHGMTREALIGRHVRELVPPDFDKEVMSVFPGWGSRQLSAYEGFSLGPNGESIPVEIRANVIDFEGQRALLLHVRDIRDRRRADAEIRAYRERLEEMVAERTHSLAESNDALVESRRTFHSIVEQSAEGILVVAADRTIRYANPAATLLLSGRSGTLVGHEFTHELSATSVFELPVRTPRNEPAVGEAIVTPTQWQGQPAHLVFLRDVSERERQLRQFRRAENLETVGLLAGGIAHDFNNLLAGILGNLSFARTETVSHEGLMDVLGEAERAAMRAKSLTQQLLTFARGGAPVRSAGSVSELLPDTVSFILAGSKSAHRLSLAPDLWNAYIDAGQISEVIENLVINADQAMPRGGTIEIVADNYVCRGGHPEDPITLKSGRYVRIAVRDQGIGMPPEVQARVFDPYFTTKPTGSGLGLAVAYSVLMKHEGGITVTSQEGVGSTFTVFLPATDVAVAARPEDASAPQRGQGRILVMDDESFIRSLVVRMLNALGYEAESVAHGGEAIERYRLAMEASRPFDAVILDLTIPGGIGGVDTMKALHELDPGVRAIVSSGYSLEPVFSSYAEHGFRGGVAKPYDMKTLASVLSKVLADA